MPHPEREHELMIEVARLRREIERLTAQFHRMVRERGDAESALAAANAELAIWRDEDAREAKYKHVSKRCTAAEEALAAARRECELWKQIAGDLYAPLEERDLHMCSASKPGDVHANVCGTFGATNCPVCLVAALAAPGDGEPDTSPATLEAWEKRLQREAEVNDPNESEP